MSPPSYTLSKCCSFSVCSDVPCSLSSLDLLMYVCVCVFAWASTKDSKKVEGWMWFATAFPKHLEQLRKVTKDKHHCQVYVWKFGQLHFNKWTPWNLKMWASGQCLVMPHLWVRKGTLVGQPKIDDDDEDEDVRYVRFCRVVIPGVFLGVLSSILLWVFMILFAIQRHLLAYHCTSTSCLAFPHFPTCSVSCALGGQQLRKLASIQSSWRHAKMGA